MQKAIINHASLLCKWGVCWLKVFHYCPLSASQMDKKSPICGAFFMLCVQIHAWNEPSSSWVNKTNGRN